jgi:hypothetical protein
VTLLSDLVLDRLLQRLLDGHAVKVVEVRLVLRRADQLLEVLLVQF